MNTTPKIFSKFRLFIWWLNRPRLYRQWLRNISNWLFHHISSDKMSSNNFAKFSHNDVFDTNKAIKKIIGFEPQEKVTDRYNEFFVQARKSIKQKSKFQYVEKGDFTRGSADLNLLYWICEGINAKKIIETGVAHGWSSLSILLSLSKRNEGILISTDLSYRKSTDDEYVGCVVPQSIRKRWRIIRKADRDALPLAIKKLGKIDMCHYDSDKSYQGRMWAYPKLWSSLKKNGVFISDDINDNNAFHDFCSAVDRNPILIKTMEGGSEKLIGIVIK